jgi:hypothetical protein
MFFSKEALKNLADGYTALDGKLMTLVENYVKLKLTKPRAREFASQAFPRRLKTMARCIKNVFVLIPPEREELPSADELSDATINIQSFVFNTYGAIDNLAWIWVSERGQKNFVEQRHSDYPCTGHTTTAASSLCRTGDKHSVGPAAQANPSLVLSGDVRGASDDRFPNSLL